jgi:hypothetical protein
MSYDKIMAIAKDLNIDKYLKKNMFDDKTKHDSITRLVFTPDPQTFIYIDLQSKKLGFYNKLSHLYYSYNLPTNAKETKQLKKVLLALIICLVEEKNNFSKFDLDDKNMSLFK